MESTAVVRSILAKQISVPVDSLTGDSRLRDIGFQSIDVVELIFALEEQFDIEIPYNSNDIENESLSTVGDVERTIEELVKKKGAAA